MFVITRTQLKWPETVDKEKIKEQMGERNFETNWVYDPDGPVLGPGANKFYAGTDCDNFLADVKTLCELNATGRIVLGFSHPDCSPVTIILWDKGYEILSPLRSGASQLSS